MKNILYILVTILLFGACEDVVQVELRDENKDLYVVDAVISSTFGPRVILSKSVPVTEQLTYDVVSGANIEVEDNLGNAVQLEEVDSLPGLYMVPEHIEYLGHASRTYTLTIYTSDDTLTASEYLAPVAPIDSIIVEPSMRGDGIFLGIFMYGYEPAGLGNYYKWDFYINDTLITDPMYLAVTNDEMVDGNPIQHFELLTDFHDPNNPEERLMPLGSTVYVVQKSLSEFVYNFYYEMLSQSSGGSLFSVSPANLSTNVSSSSGKDVLGVFMAHDESYSNVVIIDQDIEDQLVKI